LEGTGVNVALLQLRNAVVVIFSLIVMATVVPGFPSISKLITYPYFLFIPGYFFASLLEETGTILERLFYTLIWSVTIFGTVYSIETIMPSNQLFPISLVIPVLTLLLLGFEYYHRPLRGER
jgi:hypothetical protein